MASRIQLQSKLEELLGSRNVYYQPPSNLIMTYPAIRYSLSNISVNRANDASYLQSRRYELILIDKKPDNPVIDEILQLPMCTFGSHYKADNLNHYTFTLYY